MNFEEFIYTLKEDGLDDSTIIDHVRGWQQRIAELTAHVERLRDVFKYGYTATANETGETVWCVDIKIADKARLETPAQSLAEIKAAAIGEAVYKFRNADCDTWNSPSFLMDYAKQLRGEK